MMKQKYIWTLVALLGLALLVGSGALALHNLQTEMDAGHVSEEMLYRVSMLIMNPETEEESSNPSEEDDPLLQNAPKETWTRKLHVADLDGRKYVGVITLPTLRIQLPVQNTWSYPNLRVSPCRFYGSPADRNLVLCAHNYSTHFGQIKTLQPGDSVEFTDMEGVTYYYRVQVTEIMPPSATRDVVSGLWDLTLFTCTIGGRTRVVVRCDMVENDE